jgi:hypothetical protein
MSKRFPFELVAVTIVALVIWALFFPGLMSGDSCDQYRQACEHYFHDMHTPIMSIVLSFFLRIWDLHGLTFLMCLAGSLGMFGLLAGALELFYPEAWSERRRGAVAFLGFLLLLIPPSPLMFWLMTFTKDAWCMVFFLDLGACAFYLFRQGPSLRRFEYGLLVGTFMLLTELAFLSRYNALVVLPAVMWCFWQLLRRRPLPRWVAGTAAVALVPLHFAAAEGLHLAFSVKRMHPENQVMALDLIGFCVLDDRFLDEFPYTRSQLNGERYRTEYIFGDVIPLIWEQERPTIVDPEYVFTKLGNTRDGQRDVLLRAEYRRAALHHPGMLLKIKWLSFLPLLGEFNHRHITQEELPDMDYLNPQTEGPRNEVFAIDDYLAVHWRPHWLVTAHWPWMLVNLVGIVAAALAGWRWREPRFRFLFAWLLVPLLYYFSFFLANLGREFRYLYPATVMVQALTLALVLGFVFRSRKPVSGDAQRAMI